MRSPVYGTLPEKNALTRKAILWGGGGIVMMVAAYLWDLVPRAAENMNPAREWSTLALLSAGLVLWIVGCGRFARSKGHPGWYGLLGLIGIVGLFVLFQLPDKWKAALQAVPPEPSDLSNYPR